MFSLGRPYRNPTKYDQAYYQLVPSCLPIFPSWLEDRLFRYSPWPALIRLHRHGGQSFRYGSPVAFLVRRTYGQASKILPLHRRQQI